MGKGVSCEGALSSLSALEVEAALAPMVPLNPGGVHTISFWPPPSAYSGPETKKELNCHY